MNTWSTILGFAIIILILLTLFTLKRGITVNGRKILKLGFTSRVFVALTFGVVFGICCQLIFGVKPADGAGYNIGQALSTIGSAFNNALMFTIIPVVLFSIIQAITKMNGTNNGLAKTIRILAILLITAAIACIISIIVVRVFAAIFDFSSMQLGETVENPGAPKTIWDIIKSFFPNNFVGVFTSNSAVLAVIFVAVILGLAYLELKKNKSKSAEQFESAVDTGHTFTLTILDIILGFTPYGVFGLIANQMLAGSLDSIKAIGIIVITSYVALLIIFGIHLIISWIMGVTPKTYLKKTLPALMFAFSSRSSAATLPMTIRAQERLGVSPTNAALSGSFGLSIGQNGCAAMFPTLVALLVGTIQGVDIWSFSFLSLLVVVVVFSSLASGGGWFNASLMVLSLMNLPIEFVYILLSVDFLIDMGRTALNVNDSILAGLVSSKLEKNIIPELFHNRITLEEYEENQKKNEENQQLVDVAI